MQKIHYTSDIQGFLNDFIAQNSAIKKMILTDENVYSILENYFEKNELDVYIMPAGETNKNLETCSKIWERLIELKFSRKDLIINIGGGVVTDLGGFVASAYKRGIEFINVPSTLLAMVDASIGGKTGVDFNGYKNVIGSFYFPQFTVIATELLSTLPQEELISGFAEVLKHGLIKRKSYWDFTISDKITELDWQKVVEESVEIKEQIVLDDPHENGERKLLNFGHTIGHAIETHCLNNENPVLHGNAVAAGMIMESYISNQSGLLSNASFSEIVSRISNLFPVIHWERSVNNELIELMRNDKKNDSSTINFTLLKEIGEGVFNQTANEELIVEALNYYLDNISLV